MSELNEAQKLRGQDSLPVIGKKTSTCVILFKRTTPRMKVMILS